MSNLNIVVLGSGRVSRGFAAWCSAQNISRSLMGSSNNNTQQQGHRFNISVFSSCPDIGAENLVSDLPWLSAGPKYRKAASVGITGDVQTAAKKVSSADAVFFAAPMTQAWSYLSKRQAIRDAIMEQQRTRKMPLILCSRGVSLSPLNDDAAASKQFVVRSGIRTTHVLDEGITSRRAAEDGSCSKENGEKVWCAANSLFTEEEVAEKMGGAAQIVPLGGLLSHSCLLDAAKFLIAQDEKLSESLAHADAFSRKRIEMEREGLVASLAVPPPLFTPRHPLLLPQGAAAAAAAELLDTIFGAGVVERSDGTRMSVEDHAVLDASFAAAAFGSGMIKSFCVDNLAATSRVFLTQRALGSFFERLKNDPVFSSIIDQQRENSSRGRTLPRCFDGILAQTSLGTGGTTVSGNISEFGRRLSEHSSIVEAEASLFDVREGGHSPSFHRTMDALASLSKKMMISSGVKNEEERKGEGEEEREEASSCHSAFSILNDAVSGFLAPNVAAQWLSVSPGSPNAAEIQEIVLAKPHALLDDVMRLDDFVYENDGSKQISDAVPLIRNVEMDESLASVLQEEVVRQTQPAEANQKK